MTREAEIRASEQMRDRIVDMLHRAAAVRQRQGSTGHSKAKLLVSMARQASALPGAPAAPHHHQPMPETRQP